MLKKIFFYLYVIINSLFCYSQGVNSYSIDANFNPNKKEITVNQKIIFQNTSDLNLEELFLNDWSHSYSSTETPLAQRLAEEYDRSFYFSNKDKRGSTNNLNIVINKKLSSWTRLKDQKDIIKVTLNIPVKKNEIIEVLLDYRITIPNDKFTGYGKRSDDDYYLKDWFISICPIINSQWIKNSNLNLEEVSRLPSNYSIKWTLPVNFNINSNLNLQNQDLKNDLKRLTFYGNMYSNIQFHLTKFNSYKYIKTPHINFLTDIKALDLSEIEVINNFKKIDSFITNKIGHYPHSKMMISQIEYNKNPNYGLSLLPDYLRPYNDLFYHEISILKVYLTEYLNERLQINPRKNNWLHEGLLTYFTIKYIDYYYPNYKILGKVAEKPFLKKIIKGYHLSKMEFNDGFLESYEFMQRYNNHQAPITSKDKLIKFNDEISTPAQVGVGLKFLDTYLGEEIILSSIKKVMDKAIDYNGIKNEFQSVVNKDINWFFQNYIGERRSFDLKYDYINISNDSISLKVKEKNNVKIPFKIGLIKNDSIIDFKWINSGFDKEIKFKNIQADYIAINPKQNFPELNHRNNWKKISNKLMWKSIDFKFIKDLENPKKNQLFYNPITNFNAYDGLIFGFRVNNKTFKNKPSSINIIPLYSISEKTLVGSFSGFYNFFKEDKSNYLTKLSIRANTYHYENNLRYTTYNPSLNLIFRSPDFRSDLKQLISLSWLSVKRDKSSEIQTNPNYDIGIIKYLYSGKGAIKYKTFQSQLQLSGLFTKISLTAEYRRVFKNARQVSIRVFAGKFLNYKNPSRNNNFFDFSLNRSSDYLFEHNYLGRSEKKGIYSQQFIMSEGGFKSKFSTPTANDYILTSNISVGLWKWIELYVDFGVAKNINFLTKGYYDSGIRFNLLPDFLEIYLPIQSSENQIELTQNNYLSRARIVISLEPKTLLNLFNRKWF